MDFCVLFVSPSTRLVAVMPSKLTLEDYHHTVPCPRLFGSFKRRFISQVLLDLGIISSIPPAGYRRRDEGIPNFFLVTTWIASDLVFVFLSVHIHQNRIAFINWMFLKSGTPEKNTFSVLQCIRLPESTVGSAPKRHFLSYLLPHYSDSNNPHSTRRWPE